ncbi:MAG: T9SS type A sorting domain-containing protein [bacterium]
MRRLIIALVCMLVTSSHAQWPTNPEDQLWVGNGVYNSIVSDEDGGAYVAFTSFPASMQSRCYLQQLDADGYPQYPSPILLDVEHGTFIHDYNLRADGQGGCIVIVDELNTTEWTNRLGVFRYNQDGTSQYVNIAPVIPDIYVPETDFDTVTDHGGGIYILRVSGNYACQRLGPDGERLWGDNGIILDVGTLVPSYQDLAIASDGDYCYVVARGDSIYAFKFTPDGNAVWGEDGIVIQDIGYDIDIIPDGLGGLIGACRDQVDPMHHLFLFRLDSAGESVWADEGLDLGDMHFNKSLVCHPPFFYVAWDSAYNSMTDFARLMKFDLDGTPIWDENVTVFSGTEGSTTVIMRDADETGLILTASQPNPSDNTTLVAQKYDYDGNRLWAEDVVITEDLLHQHDLYTNDRGGCLISWHAIDPIYGQRICASMVNTFGEMGVVGIIPPQDEATLDFQMMTIFPNPFNAQTTISFDLPVASNVKLEVFHISGSRVGVGLAPTRWYNSGCHSIIFDGSNLPSGIYLYNLQIDNHRQTGKMLLLK